MTVTSPSSNLAPVAQATVSSCGERVQLRRPRLDRRERRDADYAWNFGNGRTATGPVPN